MKYAFLKTKTNTLHMKKTISLLFHIIIIVDSLYVDLIGNKLSYTFENLTSITDVDYLEDYEIHSNAIAASLSVSGKNNDLGTAASNPSVEIINARHANDVIFTKGSQEHYNNDHIEIYSPSLQSTNSALQKITITTDVSNCNRMPCETKWNISAKYFFMENQTSSPPLITKSMKIGFTLGVIPILSSAFPTNAPFNYKDLSFVVLTGRGFGPWKRIFQCIFDNNNQLVTAAKRIAKEKIKCSIPTLFQFKYSSIYIKDDYSGMKSNSLQFTYTEAIHLHEIIPTFGNEDGGTQVTILGEHFENSPFLSCIFDEINVKAVYISAIKIQCITPPMLKCNTTHYERRINISVSNNGVHRSNTTIQYSYVSRVTIENIQPGFTFKRNESGKQRTLKVHGKNIFSSTILCRWNEFITNATYISSTEIECEIPDYQTLLWVKKKAFPQLSDSEIVNLSISLNNGVDWTTSKITFEYRDNPSFRILEPRIGIVSGNTWITISVSESFKIQENDRFFCKFVQPMNGFIEIVPGQFLSNTSLSCLTPRSTTQGKANIEIALNGQEFIDSKLSFFYYSPPTITAMYPTIGPEVGGTGFTIFGKDFFNLERIMCSFGDNGRTSTAYVTSFNTIRCVTPLISTCGNHRLKLSDGVTDYVINIQENDTEIDTFYFFSNTTNVQISPQTGSVSIQTLVTVSVTKNSGGYCPLPSLGIYMCHFGQFLSSVATWIDSHTLSCLTPIISWNVIGKLPFTVDFSISANDRMISSFILFTYNSTSL